MSPAQIQMKPDIEVLKSLGKDFLFFVITNAGAVGKGDCLPEEFWEGECFFEAELLKKGIKIQACMPAFWNPKNPENFKEYKKYRKPSPAMILELLEKYPHIDLKNSWVVGDSNYDMEMAQAVGCKKVFLQDDRNEAKYAHFGNSTPEYATSNLTEAINFIKNWENDKK